jgi:site-specific DNA-methyltransferase (adenine-specific)
MPATVTIRQGDCLDVLPMLAEASIDACVTDPPYHLTSIVKRFGSENAASTQFGPYARASAGFMGKQWDGGDIAFRPDVWHEVFRVLKPGAHLLAFGGTRTYHRMACAIEDAGFEIRDCIQWLYGSGFPKSHDVSKGMDRAAPRVGMFEGFAKHYAECRASKKLTHAAVCDTGHFFDNHNHGGASVNWEAGYNVPTMKQWNILQPLLDLSLEWLPLIERVEVEREKIGERPSGDPVAWFAQTDRGNGTVDITRPATAAARQWQGFGTALKPACELVGVARKPLSEKTIAANVVRWGTGALNIDGCRIEASADYHDLKVTQGGDHFSIGSDIKTRGTTFEPSSGRWPANVIHDGSAEVLAGFPDSRSAGDYPSNSRNLGDAVVFTNPRNQGALYSDIGSAARFFYTTKADSDDRLGSKHPTVKPVDLMAYLCRLVTPPNGTVLDPFAGTGTVGMACMRESFNCVLIERELEYVADIKRRIAHVSGGDTPLFAVLDRGC